MRVPTASFKPGDKTVFRTHRSPVTVYVLEGAFTLEMEGGAPVTVKAFQAVMEPPHVKITGCNRSTTEPLRVVICYVSDPGTPALDPIQQRRGQDGRSTPPRPGGGGPLRPARDRGARRTTGA